MPMRTLRPVLVLMVILASPASAQPIGPSDLMGVSISFTTLRAQTVFDKGKNHPGTVRSTAEIVFGGPSNPVQLTYTNNWHGKDGHRSTWTKSGSISLGTAMALQGGHAASFLQNNTLYFVRTFKNGGYKIEIHLVRTSNGLACTSREIFLKEQGVNEKQLKSNATGRPIAVVSDRQISSTCRVIKR